MEFDVNLDLNLEHIVRSSKKIRPDFDPRTQIWTEHSGEMALMMMMTTHIRLHLQFELAL